jgi:peroxiredoxin
MLQEGQQAPLFKAAGPSGEVELGALLQKGPVVLYFFPKAFTSG